MELTYHRKGDICFRTDNQRGDSGNREIRDASEDDF